MCELTGNTYEAATTPTAPALGLRTFFAVADKNGSVDGFGDTFKEAEAFRKDWDYRFDHVAPHRVIMLREVM